MKSFVSSRIHRIANAFTYSAQGFKAALKQKPFQEELIVCTALLPIALWVDVSGIERLLLIGCLVWVLFAEMINTAVEVAIDRVGPERHILSGMAKDIGSAAVLLSIIWTVTVWVCILWIF